LRKGERREVSDVAAALPYQLALRKIYSLDRFGSKLGLERIRAILKALGNPQKKYKCVLVAGSNGKGSTVEMIGSILHADRTRVGTYFSPQIESFEERFRINGNNATKKEIAIAYAQVAQACRRVAQTATFFEVVSAMALLIFAKRKVEVAVLEVGLGGRLDATNAVEPEVSVLTSLSLEHTGVLGDTIEKIAHEKCGIARGGKMLVCGAVSGRAGLSVGKECAHAGARAIFVEDEAAAGNLNERDGKYSFDAAYDGRNYSIALSAPGKFQVSNACAALLACAELGASKAAIEKGLAGARPKFRLQKISSSPSVIADCAHNPEAASALATEVARMAVRGRRVLLFSAMKDKDYARVLSALAPLFDTVVLTEVALARGAALSELASAREGAVLERRPKKALARAKKIAGKSGLVVAAGSIYLLSALFGKEKIKLAQ
jgi:dihydrofolate synthase / folylpolyglutamate synthase